MSRRGVPPPARPPFGRPLLLLAPLLALAAALVLARPVTSWRTGADEAFYLRYAPSVSPTAVRARSLRSSGSISPTRSARASFPVPHV